MKKIILSISMFLLVFSGCEKPEAMNPIVENDTYLTIELYGAFVGALVENDTGGTNFLEQTEIDYSVVISVNGINKTVGVQDVLQYGFVGAIPVIQMKINPYDRIKITVQSNRGYDYFYKYLQVYSNPYNITKVEFRRDVELNLKGVDFS